MTKNSFIYQMLAIIFSSTLLINTTYSQAIEALGGEKISKVELDNFLKNQMDSMNIPGLSIAIINDSKIVYHRSFGIANIDNMKEVNDSTLFEAGSLSKPIYAYLVMKLIEKAVIELDTPLYKYLPNPDIEYDKRYKHITPRMVLCHSSGFPNWRENKLDIKFDPGTSFLYSGEGYVYLNGAIGYILNNDAVKMELLFKKEVTEPLGIENACFLKNPHAIKHKAIAHNENGIVPNSSPWWHELNFNIAGGLHTEAVSYATFLIAMIERKGLKEETFDEMLKEQIQVPKDLVEWTWFGYTGWGLGFALKPSPYGMNYCHTGNTLGFTSGFMINLEKKFGFVFFTNSDQANGLNPKLEGLLIYDK